MFRSFLGRSHQDPGVICERTLSVRPCDRERSLLRLLYFVPAHAESLEVNKGEQLYSMPLLVRNLLGQ